MDTQKHVRAKLSRMCAIFLTFERRTLKPVIFSYFWDNLTKNVKSYMFFKLNQGITLSKIVSRKILTLQKKSLLEGLIWDI